jgi:segregation and condensation protein A
MENPVFRLEGVVRAKGGSEDFVGPLAVILQLLSKNKIEIQDISVSLILDQYLEWLGTMAAMDLDVASEFVAMASHLAYIKTKTLLSGGEEVSELEELISSLERFRAQDVYTRIKTVTERLAAMYTSGAGLIVKPPEPLMPDTHYRYAHERRELADAITRIAERGGLTEDIVSRRRPFMPDKLAYPLSDKLAEVLARVRRFGVLRVFPLFWECGSRSEAVATFIAVLELCRTGSVVLAGEDEETTMRFTGELNAELLGELAELGDEIGNSGYRGGD